MKQAFTLLATLFFVTNQLRAQEKGVDQRIDEAFKPISDTITNAVFFEVFDTPFVLILLVGSALFFTLYLDVEYFYLILRQENNFRHFSLQFHHHHCLLVLGRT